MALVKDETLPDESRPLDSQKPTAMPTSNNMKFPRVLRRGSSIESVEKQKERENDSRRASVPEPSRKSTLSTLPLRLRRRKTQPMTEYIAEESISDNNLGHLLFSLPSEILAEILIHLTLQDIYALRLTSKTFTTFLNYNASTITRSILSSALSPNTPIDQLYPRPQSQHSLHHLFSTLRRAHNATSQIYTLLSFVQMKIYMTRTTTRVLSVSDNRQRLISAFHRPSWFLSHFLEAYRDIVIHEHPSHTHALNCSSCEDCKSLARDLVATYPAGDVMPTYHFFQLSLQHLQIATRAPSAAGALERKLRGWGKAPVTEEALGIFVILGGVPEIRKVAMMQGSYNSRLGFVLEFVEKVRDAVSVNEILGGGKVRSPGVPEWTGEEGDGTCGRRDKRSDSTGSEELMGSLSPPYHLLTQGHITSLPDVNRFFYDIWKDRIHECAPDREDITEPYPWLQRVMSGSGVEFTQSRYPDTSLALGASPV